MFGSARKKVEDARGAHLPEPNKGLPDSDTGSGLCPRCGTLSSFEAAGSAPLTFDGGYISTRDHERERTYTDRLSVLYCRHCHQGVVVVEEQHVGGQPARQGRTSGEVHWKGIHWWPLPDAGSMSDVPPNVARAFAEASRALYARCFASAAVMGRRTVEAVTEDKGSATGSLKSRIDDMGKRGILHPTLVEWATQVRLIGNVGAHFDPIDEVTAEDAASLIGFAREFLKYIYELPAQLGRQQRAGGSATAPRPGAAPSAASPIGPTP